MGVLSLQHSRKQGGVTSLAGCKDVIEKGRPAASSCIQSHNCRWSPRQKVMLFHSVSFHHSGLIILISPGQPILHAIFPKVQSCKAYLVARCGGHVFSKIHRHEQKRKKTNDRVHSRFDVHVILILSLLLSANAARGRLPRRLLKETPGKKDTRSKNIIFPMPDLNERSSHYEWDALPLGQTGQTACLSSEASYTPEELLKASSSKFPITSA